MLSSSSGAIWRRMVTIAILPVLTGSCDAATGHRRPRTRGLIPALGVVTNGAVSPGRYVSPDHRYVAVVTHGGADVAHLSIQRRGPGTPKILIRDVPDISGIVWIPGSKHTLAVAQCSVYSESAGIFLWKGAPTLYRVVPPSRSRKPKSAFQECYYLYSVTHDGRVLVYSHSVERPHASAKSEEAQVRHRLRVVLPTH